MNPSEDGIGNVTVRLLTPGPDGIVGNGDDVLVDTVTTDTNGFYSFTGLGAGSYYVDVVQGTLPPGLAPTVGTTDPTGVIQLADGQAFNGANFGYASATGSLIGDSVFYDANGDGFQDPGEAGIGGVGVTVTGPSGTFNRTTDAGGLWLVAGLAAGQLPVTVNTATLPPGYNTTPTNGPASRNFAVAAGADFLRADFGFNAPAGTTGTIGDTVFFDTNGNGVQNGVEGGIAGVTLRLLNGSGSVVATTTTGVNGSYDFVGVPPGDYTVEVTDIFGALFGLNISAGTNPSSIVTLAAGGDVNDVDFGYTSSGGAGSIGGFIWHDTNGNGVVNAAEANLGLQGVTVRLYLDVNGNGVVNAGVDNLIRITLTDVIGEYQMNGLPPGIYLVDVTDTIERAHGLQQDHRGRRRRQQQPGGSLRRLARRGNVQFHRGLRLRRRGNQHHHRHHVLRRRRRRDLERHGHRYRRGHGLPLPRPRRRRRPRRHRPADRSDELRRPRQLLVHEPSVGKLLRGRGRRGNLPPELVPDDPAPDRGSAAGDARGRELDREQLRVQHHRDPRDASPGSRLTRTAARWSSSG